MAKVRLVAVTPGAEDLISYCARVSNPSNQENYETAPKLLRYLIEHGHWSPFEMANMVVEIETTRAIAPQILRHRSFSFQEFSQRYASAEELGYEYQEARRQDAKNRQNSWGDPNWVDKDWFLNAQEDLFATAFELYEDALARGIAKECARALLPLNTKTRLYMNGTVRSWIHYLQLRTGNGTQLEHKLIADQIHNIFAEQFPNISEALWPLN